MTWVGMAESVSQNQKVDAGGTLTTTSGILSPVSRQPFRPMFGLAFQYHRFAVKRLDACILLSAKPFNLFFKIVELRATAWTDE